MISPSQRPLPTRNRTSTTEELQYVQQDLNPRSQHQAAAELRLRPHDDRHRLAFVEVSNVLVLLIKFMNFSLQVLPLCSPKCRLELHVTFFTLSPLILLLSCDHCNCNTVRFHSSNSIEHQRTVVFASPVCNAMNQWRTERGVWGVQPPPAKFQRYWRSPRSHEQEEPAFRFPFVVHCVLIRL